MRIVINSTVTSQKEKTGIATFASNLLKAINKLAADNSYDIFTLNDRELEAAGKEGFKIHSFPGLFHRLPVEFSWICWYLWQYTGFNLQLGAIKPDVYLSLDFSLPGYRKCPRVCMVYDLTPLLLEGAYPARFKARYKMQVDHAVKHADIVVTISEAARKDILAYFTVDPEKIKVIYPGFDESTFTPEKDPENDSGVLHGHGINYPYILYLGALENKKNIPRLIEAFEKVKKDVDIPHRLVLGGKRSWNDVEIFKKIDGSPVRNDISYIGYVPYRDLPVLLRNADVFVFPSLSEGFGIPPLEAMACGVPVITSDSSSLPEVVADAGLLVDPHDVDMMAGAVSRVLSDRELRLDMINRGLQRAKLFSWQKAAQDMLDILAKV